jgi:hypothetical protein
MKAEGVKAATDPKVKAEMAASFMLLLSVVYKLCSITLPGHFFSRLVVRVLLST